MKIGKLYRYDGGHTLPTNVTGSYVSVKQGDVVVPVEMMHTGDAEGIWGGRYQGHWFVKVLKQNGVLQLLSLDPERYKEFKEISKP